MTDLERDSAVREIRHDISKTRTLLKALLAVVFVALAIMSVTGIVTSRVSTDTKDLGEQNRQFLQNFSDYMRCLVVNDDTVVLAVGEEKYFNLCDDLLFRNTGLVPTHTKVTIPPEFTSTTTIPPLNQPGG
jgi:hypothetical protein